MKFRFQSLAPLFVAFALSAAAASKPPSAKLNFFFGKDPSRWRRDVPARSVKADQKAGLTYSTFLGGGNTDHASAIATDSNGNIYVTGYTSSVDFPTTPGSLKPDSGVLSAGSADIFVAKFDPDGNLLYCTYLGGASDDRAFGIAVDSDGNAYITGSSRSADFPITTAFVGSTFYQGVVVAKLNPAGNALVYATLVGGLSSSDSGAAIALDTGGNAVVTGYTTSPDFSTTPGAALSGSGPLRGFVAKLNAAGSDFIWVNASVDSSDIPKAIALDPVGSVYLAGSTYGTTWRPSSGVQTTNASHNLARSTDQGTQWAVPGNGLDGKVIVDFNLDPSNNAIVYASGTGGVYRSADAGTSWTPVFASDSGALRTVVDPGNPNHLIVFAVQDNSTVEVITRDGGVTWSTPAKVDFRDMVFDSRDPNSAYAAAFTEPYFSRDGGDTWSTLQQYLGVYQWSTPVIDPFNSNTLYSATPYGLYESTNRGTSWFRLSYTAFSQILPDPRRPGFLYGVPQSLGNPLMFSPDGGLTWAVTSISLVTKVAINPQDPATLFVFTVNGVFSTTDRATLQPLGGLPPNPAISSLYFDQQNPGTWWALSTQGADAFITKLSADGGTLLFSTYFGGSANDLANTIALDPAGNIYIGGTTTSADLNGAQTKFSGVQSAFLAKFANDGSQLGYSRFLGGARASNINGIGMDASGNAVAVGVTFAPDFPLTADAVRTTPPATATSAFATRFDPNGSILFSSFLGGSQGDNATAVAIGPSGRACIAGDTNSPDLVATPNAAQTVRNGFTDAFLMILDFVQ